MKKVLIVDGSSLGSRAYFVPQSPFEFFNMVLAVLKDTNPDYVVFAFDNGEPDPRKQIYPDYKAHRNEEDGVLRRAYNDALCSALERAGFLTLRHSEGDDVIGTVERAAREAGHFSYIVSGDTDLMALASSSCHVIWYGRYFSDRRLYNPLAVESKIGVPPHLVYDYIALVGEQSDNIPGVRGIGPAGAIEMLQALGNLEEVLEYGPESFSRYRRKLEEGREMARISYQLARIRDDIPLQVDFKRGQFKHMLTGAVQNFRTWLQEV